MAELFKVNAPVRKPLFEGVQGENEARSIQFDVTPWVEELGDGAVTATAKRSQDSQPYPVTVTKDGNVVTWKPTSTDTAFAGVGSFQLEYTVDSVLAKTCIWSTMVAPSLDPAGDPPDPYDNWLAEMRQIAADALQSEQNAEDSAEDAEAWAKGTKNGTPVSSSDAQYQNNSKYFAEESYKNAEAWAVGQRGGVDVPSTDPTYENNAKYWAEQSLANQYGAYIVKSASGEIASFSDGADDVPMKSLKVAIVPKQAGSGDPSPSNVRPITGTSTANVTVKGKNLYNPAVQHLNTNYVTLNGDTFTMTWDDGGVRIYGKWVTVLQGFQKGRYTLQFIGTNVTYLRAQLIRVSNDTSIMSVSNGQTFTVDEDFYINIYGSYSHHDTAVFKVQLETGETATAYEPYAGGHTTPVPLGQTVYGANVGVTEGEMKITKLGVDLGSLTWADTQTASDADGRTVYYTSASWGTPTGQNPAICSVAVQHAPVPIGQLHVTSQGFTLTGGNFSTVWMLFTDHARTGAQVKSELNGQMLVADVFENMQQTVQLTPTQVASLLGTNNVWSDAGSVAVEYRADPTLAYAELEALILENI